MNYSTLGHHILDVIIDPYKIPFNPYQPITSTEINVI